MKIFLHIGIEKTGSTTIQKFLALNEAELLQRGLGISKSLGVENNVMIAAYAMGHQRSNSIHKQKNISEPAHRADFDLGVADNFIREVGQLPSHVHSIVLSNEHCHSNLIDTQELEKLRELLSRVSDDITIIVYLRRQIDVCVSLYSTLLKHGYKTDFDQHISQLSLTHFYNYLDLVNMWSDVFGKDRMKLRIFDRQKLLGGDLIIDFCDAIDLVDISSFKLPDNLNESLTPETQNLLLQLNRFRTPGATSDRTAQSFKVLADTYERLKSHLVGRNPGKGQMPNRAVALQKQSIFDASNEKLNSIYFNEKQSLFSESFDEFPT